MDLGAWSDTVFWWGMGLSVAALVATAVGIPWVVARLPRDYFANPGRSTSHSDGRRPLRRVLLAVGKNVLGAVLVLMGVVMLLAPGQGVLTLLVGLMLLDFPGRPRMIRWLVRRKGVMRALNWLRRRTHQEPFDAPRRP